LRWHFDGTYKIQNDKKNPASADRPLRGFYVLLAAAGASGERPATAASKKKQLERENDNAGTCQGIEG
jgi:hypothetical protein